MSSRKNSRLSTSIVSHVASESSEMATFDALPKQDRVRAYILASFAVLTVVYDAINMDTCHLNLLIDMCKYYDICTDSVHQLSQSARFQRPTMTTFNSAYTRILRSMHPTTTAYRRFGARFQMGYNCAIDTLNAISNTRQIPINDTINNRDLSSSSTTSSTTSSNISSLSQNTSKLPLDPSSDQSVID
jgi:hypothetical protein